jgi:tetratricopeptide (TPR) repeat protein
MQWGLDHNPISALSLASVLGFYWGARGLITEGRRWVEVALDAVTALPNEPGKVGQASVAARARGLLALSQMNYGDGDYQIGLAACHEAVRLYRELGDPFGLGMALGTLGNMAAFQGDSDLAERALLEAVQIGHALENPALLCFATGVLGQYVYMPRGDLEAAWRSTEESMQYARLAGMTWAVAQGELIFARIAALKGEFEVARVHTQISQEIAAGLRDTLLLNMAVFRLGDIELQAGNLAESQRYLSQSILVFQEIGQRAYVSHGLESFAFIAKRNEQPERAARLLAAGEALREGLGTSLIAVMRLDDEYDATIAWLHERLDDATYEAIWSEGCGISMDQAVALALEE